MAKRWYVVHAYSGFEKKVAAALKERIERAEMQDIFAAGATHIRTYIGLTDEMKLKLLLVGVDASNNDMINYEADQYVYDFNQPCPTNCAEKSPLYIATISH